MPASSFTVVGPLIESVGVASSSVIVPVALAVAMHGADRVRDVAP